MTIAISNSSQSIKNDLPDGWSLSDLGDVVDILDGQRVPVNATEREKRKGDIPYYGATGQVGWIDDYLFDEELILLGEDGAPFFDPAKPKAYIIRGKSWVNNHAHVLRARNGIPNGYIKYYLDIVAYHKFVSGTTRLKLNQSAMRRIPIPIAPSNEQKLIVSEIEKQFSRLDEAVVALKRIQANLKRYKAAALKAAVEGKLTEQWRTELPDIEPASELLKRILTERRKKWEEDYIKKYVATHGYVPKDDSWKKKYKEPAPPDTSNLAELPKGWVWITIEQVCEVGTGATPLRSKKEYYAHGTIPWVTSAALNELFVNEADEYITKLALKETNVKVFPKHTLLVAMYGEGKTRGKVSELMIEAGTNQACAALIFDGISEQIRPYLKLFFQKNYDDIRRLSSGGVQPNLNLGIIKDTLVPLLPIKEQAQMLEIIDQRLSIIYLMGKEINDNLKRAERLRQSILKKAFLGQLISKDQSNERKNNIGKRNV